MYHVSRETLEQIKSYYNVLLKWNKTHNLIQNKQLSFDFFYQRHVLDAFALFDHIPPGASVLDVGSGNGLPGVILGLLGCRIDLCEIGVKKVSFLKMAAAELGLNTCVIDKSCYSIDTHYDVLVSKAFTSLGNLMRIQNNVSRETSPCVGVYLKGDGVQAEIAEARLKWRFECDVYKTEKGCVVKTYNVRLLDKISEVVL